jgi:SWI/SNF-related matrix-associated actin-dependent regulator of chromatin subfamily A-like protein 1
MLTKPFKYQRIGIKRLQFYEGRALLADDMGLGKSLQALGYAEREDKFPLIIICQATLKYNWEREVKIHLGRRARILEGTKPPKKTMIQEKIVIINYDILGPWIEWLRAMKPRCVIIDECQEVKGLTTQRNENCRKICKGVESVIGVSGTAFTNRPSELFPICNILWPNIFNSFWSFSEKFCEPRLISGKWHHKGARNLGELHTLLKQCGMIRRKKEDVLKDLPEKQRFVVPMDISSHKEYQKAVKDFFGWLKEKGGIGKAMKASRADAFVQVGYLKRLAAELKMPAMMQWIDNFLEQSEDEKIIVFGIHKKILLPLHKKYEDISVRVDGSVSSRKRHAAIEEFNHTKKKRIFFGQIKACGTGWSATSASKVAHAELWWNPAMHDQAEARIHGVGRGIRGKVSQSYYLVAHKTIEESICEMLEKKQNVFDQVFDGRPGVEDFNLFDKLMSELAKGENVLCRQ